MTIQQDIQRPSPGALIEMFELDISSITGTNTLSDHYYFHDGVSASGAPIVWQGNTYNPWPVQADGFDVTTNGTQPRPQVTLGNVNGILTALCRDYQDLVGAVFIRRRTFGQFLDGQPGADPGQHLPDHIFKVERKLSHDRSAVKWELASALDMEDAVLPSRRVLVEYCGWDYRQAECTYTGSSYFDVNDQAVGSLALDVCSKSVNGCKLRFGANNPLPFGGFRAVKLYKV